MPEDYLNDPQAFREKLLGFYEQVADDPHEPLAQDLVPEEVAIMEAHLAENPGEAEDFADWMEEQGLLDVSSDSDEEENEAGTTKGPRAEAAGVVSSAADPILLCPEPMTEAQAAGIVLGQVLHQNLLCEGCNTVNMNPNDMRKSSICQVNR